MNTAQRYPAAHHETDRTDPRADQTAEPSTTLFNTRAIGFLMGWELYDPVPAEAEAARQATLS